MDEFVDRVKETFDEWPDLIDERERVQTVAPEQEEIETGQAKEVQAPISAIPFQGAQLGVGSGMDALSQLSAAPVVFSGMSSLVDTSRGDDFIQEVEENVTPTSGSGGKTIVELREMAIESLQDALEQNR